MALDQTSIGIPSTEHFLRNLYFSRTVIQILWAAAVLATAPASPGFAVILVLLYPLWDVICTIRDLRSNPQPMSKGLQLANAFLGSATTIAIGVFGTIQLRYAIAAFGLWALLAGLLQLGVGLARRRSLKGQWAMILSGAQSALAGTAFLLGGLKEKVHVKDLGGYAIFGAVYFLIAALLLNRKGQTGKTIAGSAIAVLLLATLAGRGNAQEAIRDDSTSQKGVSVILVHGAWADGSSWDKVIPLLKAKGLHVTAVQLPLTSLADDVAVVQRAIAVESAPIILVSHSYGGVVITQAGDDPKVQGLVYVAAFAPAINESVQTLNARFAPTPIMTEITADSKGFLKLTPKGIEEDFAQDLPPIERANLAATQGPTFMNVLGTPVTSAAWQLKPSWFVVAENDRAISPELERSMAKTIGAHTVEVASSHVAMLAKPAVIADVIEDAVAATQRTSR